LKMYFLNKMINSVTALVIPILTIYSSLFY
jgi:hypothetical protein